MKTLKCSDLFENTECDFKVSGKTDEEIMDDMFEHTEKAHKKELAKMSEEDKEIMEEKMFDLLDAQK